MRCVSRVIHRFMQREETVGITTDVYRVGAVQISTDLSPIERRVGVACKIAKWKMGVAH